MSYDKSKIIAELKSVMPPQYNPETDLTVSEARAAMGCGADTAAKKLAELVESGVLVMLEVRFNNGRVGKVWRSA